MARKVQQIEDEVRQTCMRCSGGAVGIDAQARIACALTPPFPCVLIALLHACETEPELCETVLPEMIAENARASIPVQFVGNLMKHGTLHPPAVEDVPTVPDPPKKRKGA